MLPPTTLTACFVLVAAALATPDECVADNRSTKSSRFSGYVDDGGIKMRRIPGMFPRPIVGRSNPAATWLVDLTDFSDVEGKQKRGEISGLFAYPRVGRSGSPSLYEIRSEGPDGKLVGPIGRYHGASKRDGEGANGLWFGPRLGRSHKRSDATSVQAPWAVISLREYPPNNRHHEASSFTPRLGRESGEEVPDDLHSEHI